MQHNSLGDVAGEARKKKSDQETLEAKSSKHATTITPTTVLGTIRSSQHYESDDLIITPMS